MKGISFNKTKLFDLIFCAVLLLASIPFILLLKLNFLTTTFILFGAPAIYLTFRKRKSTKRIIAGSILFGIMFGFFLDFLAEYNNAWAWPNVDGLVFPHKLFGLVPLDVIFWYFLWIFLILTFYEHFFENRERDVISHHFPRMFILSVISILTLIIIFLTKAELLQINYAYLFLGTLTLPPFVWIIYRRQNIIVKMILANIYYAILFFVFEILALRLNQWSFPGQYLIKIGAFGVYPPVEEIFFWIILRGGIIIAYYEHWVDDEK